MAVMRSVQYVPGNREKMVATAIPAPRPDVEAKKSSGAGAGNEA